MPTPRTSFLSSNLKTLRARMGCSQQELATAIGASRTALAGWERSVAEPSIKHLLALEAYTGIGLDLLVAEDLGRVKEFQWRALQEGMRPRAVRENVAELIHHHMN